MLSHGMKQVGGISVHHLAGVFAAVLNPWVTAGIVALLAFFASYMNALSWADLSYVMPATSMGYVFLALSARFFLHEHVSPVRWLGIVLITAGVGFVTGGEALTKHEPAGGKSDAEFPLLAKAARSGASQVDKSVNGEEVAR